MSEPKWARTPWTGFSPALNHYGLSPRDAELRYVAVAPAPKAFPALASRENFHRIECRDYSENRRFCDTKAACVNLLQDYSDKPPSNWTSTSRCDFQLYEYAKKKRRWLVFKPFMPPGEEGASGRRSRLDTSVKRFSTTDNHGMLPQVNGSAVRAAKPGIPACRHSCMPADFLGHLGVGACVRTTPALFQGSDGCGARRVTSPDKEWFKTRGPPPKVRRYKPATTTCSLM